MSESSYWSRTAALRLSRRRMLAAGGAAAAAAAALAACGGDEEGPTAGVKDTSGLITEIEESTKRATAGGVWQDFLTGEPTGFNPMAAASGALEIALNAYSQIITFGFGSKGKHIETFPPAMGDAAESWERSPDGLTWTFKVRQNLRLDPRAPTNGRNVNAADWLYSWNAYVAGAPAANEVANKIDPNAPIESFSTPDSRTVVVKLAYPYVPLLELFADWRLSFMIVPVEHDGKYNSNTETRGSGPFYLHNYTPSARVEWRKNPNYWDAPRPYLDGRDMPIVPEYAQQLTQLKAGNIWSLKSYIRSEDVLATKKDVPKLDMYVVPAYRLSDDRANTRTMDFSRLPDSPFHDIRVRRATSMLIDYDALNDLQWNLSRFREQGIELPYRHYSVVSAADDRYWLDPTDEKQIGEGARYHRQNLAEAATLFRAAGINGVELPVHVGANATIQQQAVAEMLKVGGHWKASIVTHSNANDRLLNYHRGKGSWTGVLTTKRAGGVSDPDIHAVIWYSKSEFRVWPDKGPWDDLLEKQRIEPDPQRRKDLWYQIQRQAFRDVDFITAPYPTIAIRLGLAWPRFGNFASIFPMQDIGAVQAWSHFWDDKTKA